MAKYYELAYFEGRRDTKCVVIETDLEMRNNTLDEFLTELVERNLITVEEADNITWIDEIDKKTYDDMKEDFKSDII